MAAATTFGSLAASSSSYVPDDGYPRVNPFGLNYVSDIETLATTRIDDIGDITCILPVPSGAILQFLDIGESTDMDGGGPTLDMDVVIYYVVNGVAQTTTQLWNAGTWYNGAQATGRKVLLTTQPRVPKADNGTAWIALEVIAAATTPAQGTAQLGVAYLAG